MLLLLACLTLPACGPKNFANENDTLRRENLELERRVEDLEADLQRRLGELETLRARGDESATTLSGAETPVLSAVELGRYTGPIDSDGDGADDRLRLYVKTLDQRGRMLPVAARATVQAVRLTEGEPPALYLERTWDAPDFDAAYRTGFTGTHYTLELPLDDNAPDELTVRVTITASGGATFSAQKAFRITR